jgi:hypothetical protein
MVMPGVHIAPLAAVPHVAPMEPLESEQSDPLQQMLGYGTACGVHVSPGLHAPVVSHRHPRSPMMQVADAPTPDPVLPEPAPEPDEPPKPLDPVDESAPVSNEAPPSAPSGAFDEVPPQAPIPASSEIEPQSTGPALDLRLVMTSPPLRAALDGRASTRTSNRRRIDQAEVNRDEPCSPDRPVGLRALVGPPASVHRDPPHFFLPTLASRLEPLRQRLVTVTA